MSEVHKPPPPEAPALSALIRAFIQERLQDKLDKLGPQDDEKRQPLLSAYEPQAWLADAARRVHQIQLVSFGLKFSHPDARGSSLYFADTEPRPLDLIGTHNLGNDREDDVVGNAAALDVYKLLKLSHGGRTLLQRAVDGDPALRAALSDDDELAGSWVQAFGAIAQAKGDPSSHTLAKQLYFPLPEGGYHVLAPLFPTSLVHRVYTTIQHHRFSDASKDARQAFREGRPWPTGFCEYPNLAIQKVGGTKPQNISQLNSERRGEVYLLPSYPPVWRSITKPPTRMKSVFARLFGQRRAVRDLTRTLRTFLASTDYNNRNIRRTRKGLITAICDELMQFAAEISELPAAWSAEPECRLDAVEALWLDPHRAHTDLDFARGREQGDWRDEVCSRFAKWLNSAIQASRTPMGDAEYAQWHSDLDDELRKIRLEIGDHA